MKVIPVAAAIILNEGDQVLLAQRPSGKDLAGYWEFPGGKIEAGESPEQALRRELKEELKLEVGVDRYLGEFPYHYDWAKVVLSVFVVRALKPPQATKDVQVFRWETFDGVDTDQLAPADVEPWLSFLNTFKTRV